MANEFFKGHQYGWELTSWKFCIAEDGEIFIASSESLEEYFEAYLSIDELKEKSPEFLYGMQMGSKAAAQYIKEYSKKLMLKADQ